MSLYEVLSVPTRSDHAGLGRTHKTFAKGESVDDPGHLLSAPRPGARLRTTITKDDRETTDESHAIEWFAGSTAWLRAGR